MRELTKIELNKKILAMRVRAKLRLRSQEQYVRELNAQLPALEAEHDRLAHQDELMEIPEAFPMVIEAR